MYNISDLSELHDGSKRWKGSTVGTFVARRLLGKKLAAGGNANSANMNQPSKFEFVDGNITASSSKCTGTCLSILKILLNQLNDSKFISTYLSK